VNPAHRAAAPHVAAVVDCRQSTYDKEVEPLTPTRLAVAGAHLSGQPLHPFLLDLGAVYERTTQTAPVYRMVALPGRVLPGLPPIQARPGLIRLAAEGTGSDASLGGAGAAIEVEVYRIPVLGLGRLMLTVAPPLAIGTVLLADGSQVKGFICEAYVRDDAPDITHLGGWRSYVGAG
jgi:allophanate hydrolase